MSQPATTRKPSSSAVYEVGSAPDQLASRLLIVDDENGIRTALARFFHDLGYEVQTAADATSALDLLTRHRFAVMLCDVRMPGMSGVELVQRVHQADPELAIVMLSALNDARTATSTLTQGAVDYLTKPVHFPELERAIERALRARERLVRQRTEERRVREQVELRTAELVREQAALKALSLSVVETLIHAMEAKDMYLLGHSHRVAELAASVASQMGLAEELVERTRIAGRLHDVGKIGIRESVLNKPGALSPEEFDHVKEHVRIGMDILAPLEYLGPSLAFVHDHHEHWDGSGYPRGLQGTDISIGGRILAAADAFDALTSHRAYRDPMSPERTLAFLEEHSGTLLDPDVYSAMRLVVEQRQALVFIDPHA